MIKVSLRKFDSENKKWVNVPTDVSFEVDSSSLVSCSQVVRSLRQRVRQGTVSCKNRGDVAFSSKKPWRQKGTGRARAGSARSPIWRSGGVVFGPTPRIRNIRVGKKHTRKAFLGVLADRLKNKNVFLVEDAFSGEKPSASSARKMISKFDSLGRGRILLFLPFDDKVSALSFRNFGGKVSLMGFDEPNLFHMMRADRWFVFSRDLDQFKSMVSKWI